MSDWEHDDATAGEGADAPLPPSPPAPPRPWWAADPGADPTVPDFRPPAYRGEVPSRRRAAPGAGDSGASSAGLGVARQGVGPASCRGSGEWAGSVPPEAPGA